MTSDRPHGSDDRFTPTHDLFTEADDSSPQTDQFTPLFEPLENPQPVFIEQVAKPGGIHSCYPTAILNGLIQRGDITTTQALDIQEHLIRDRQDLFGPKPIIVNGKPIMTFNANPYKLKDIIRERHGKEVGIHVHRLADIPDPASFIELQLQNGNPVIGGTVDHAYTGISAGKTPHMIHIIDPMNPTTPLTWHIERFSDIAKGDGWLTVIQSENQHEPSHSHIQMPK